MKISNLPIQNHHSDSQNYHLNDAGEIIIESMKPAFFLPAPQKDQELS